MGRPVWDSLLEFILTPVSKTSPDLEMMFHQICIMKCYFCLYILRRYNVAFLINLSCVFTCLYTLFVVLRINRILNVSGMYLNFPYRLPRLSSFELAVLVIFTLKYKIFEYFVDNMIISHILLKLFLFTARVSHLGMYRSHLSTHFWHGIAFCYAATIFKICNSTELQTYVNNYVSFSCFISFSTFLGSLFFPAEKDVYLCISIVLLIKDAIRSTS